MIQSNKNNTVQAVPLIEGKVNLGPGKYFVNSLIHCEKDAEITFGKRNTPHKAIATRI